MKRVLRSAASKSDAENEPPTKLQKSIPQTRRKAAIVKQNLTLTTDKNGRKQPLKEQNVAVLGEKNGTTNKSKSSVRSAKLEPVITTPKSFPTNDSKTKTRTKLIDDVHRIEKDIVNTQPQNKKSDQPKPSTGTKSPIVVMSRIVNKRKKQSKNAPSQENQEKSPIAVQEIPPSRIHNTRRQLDEQKVPRTKISTKKNAVASTGTNNSDIESSALEQIRRSRRREPTKKAAVTSPVRRRPVVRDNKTSHASNVTVRRNEQKQTSKPNEEPTQFVTIKRGRNLQTGKSKEVKEPVISNVTTRRRATKAICSDNLEEIKKATSDTSRTRRSQSACRAIKEQKMDTNSSIKRIDAASVKRQKISKQTDQKIASNSKAAKQPQPSVNRSTASDSSNQSNGSTIPIYKRTSGSNNNTVNSVFDFESNSQEVTLNKDDQMQEVIAKMVRENKASVIKHKGNAKKGITKAKANVTRAKKIEKIRSDLKELKELKLLNSKATVQLPKINKTMSKPQIKTPSFKKASNDIQDDVSVIDLVDEVDDNTKESSCKPKNRQSVHQESYADEEFVNDPVIHVQDFEENADIVIPQIRPLTLPNVSNANSPRRVQTTYAGPKNANNLYQSTPVRIVPSGNASPWRCDPSEVKYSGNAFSRYSELEKSPIKSGDVTKATVATSSPNKKKPQQQRQPLATKQVSNILPEIEKPKTIANDIQTGFGFFDDVSDDENDECLPRVRTSFGTSVRTGTTEFAMTITSGTSPKKFARTATLPKKSARTITLPKKSAAKTSSPKKSATVTSPSKLAENSRSSGLMSLFKLPKALNSIRETVQSLKNTQQAPAYSDILNEPKSKTQSKIVSHFGNPDIGTASKPSSSKGSKLTVNKKKIETTRTKEMISETETTTSYMDHDGPSLFETTWPDSNNQTHRSYSRVTKRDHKPQYDYHKNIMTDDESEFGDTVAPKRQKRTKQKDDKYEEELRQWEERNNSEFMEVDKFEMVMEKSTLNI